MNNKPAGKTHQRPGLFLFCMIILVFTAGMTALLPSSAMAAKTSSKSTESGKAGWVSEDGHVSYLRASGRKVTGFFNTGKYWYHFDSEGNLSTGWFTVGSARYYAKPSGTAGRLLGSLTSGFRNVGGVYYYFAVTPRAGTFGKQSTGWVNILGKTYYYYEDGSKASGLSKIGRKIYYFSPAGSARKRGRLYTGWKTIDGHKYYFRPSGRGTYYGAAYTNKTVRIGKKIYKFNSEGFVSENDSTESTTNVSKVKVSGQNGKFIEQIGSLAHADMQSSGILASVTVAQAIVESNYGKSTLAVKAHNLFGMKASLSGNNWTSPWNGKVYKKKTLEYKNGRYVRVKAKFRKYANWSQSIADHSAYLAGAMNGRKPRYKGIVGETNYRKAATIIKNGGYATAPNYVSAICAVIEKFDLTRFD